MTEARTVKRRRRKPSVMQVKDVKRRRRWPGELPTRRTAIRCHCVECMGYNAAEVRRCPARECWLWPYRMGTAATVDVEQEARAGMC